MNNASDDLTKRIVELRDKADAKARDYTKKADKGKKNSLTDLYDYDQEANLLNDDTSEEVDDADYNDEEEGND